MSEKAISRKPPVGLFQFFTELAIIHQLSTASFNQVMPDGLHISHFSAISHLMHADEGSTPIQIAKALQVTKATMTHTLSVLQKRQLIEVRNNPEDGRSKLVCLTAEGRQFHKKAILSLKPTFEQMSQECDVDALSATLPILKELRVFLDKSRI